MKSTKLIFILIMIFSLSIIGCNEKDKPNYNYTNYKEETVKKVQKDKEQYNFEGRSCWFVVWELKNEPKKVNSFIMQPHKGFSMKEFKEVYGEDTFVVSLSEVSYGTYLLNTE